MATRLANQVYIIFTMCMLIFLLLLGTTRLIDSTNGREGIVLVYRPNAPPHGNKRWGLICADKWTVKEAEVVCKSLGLPKATYEYKKSTFIYGYKKYLTSVKCTGTEESIHDCQYFGWEKARFCYERDAGVVCGVPDCEFCLYV